MRSASKITPTGAVVVLALLIAALTVPAASASPLLSGYGGPGQGNQVILGSALLNGPSDRGGGSSGGGSGGGGSSDESLAVSASRSRAAQPTSRPASGSTSKARAHTPQATAGRPAQDASNSAAAAYLALERDRGSRPFLGFSVSDLLYVVIGLGVLALTAVLTRRLAGRQPASRGGGSRPAAHVPTRK
jgi:hypothetical protein